MVLEGDSGRGLGVIRLWKSGVPVKDLHMKAGGRGKGVPLDMIDKKHKIAKLITACQGFVGRVALMVYRAQQNAQFTG